MSHLNAEPLLTTERLIRDCYDECDRPAAVDEDVDVDLAALATAFSRRLRDAGMLVTPSQSERYARSLGLARPASRGALYWTTRAVFVTSTDQAPTFDCIFRDVFGAAGTPLRLA